MNSSKNTLFRILSVVFRSILSLYPATYRKRFGGEMEAMFSAGLAQECGGKPAGTTLIYGFRALLDLSCSGLILRIQQIGRCLRSVVGRGLGRGVGANRPSPVLPRVRSLGRPFRWWSSRPLLFGTCLVTLSVGLASITAILGILDSVLLRPLPYPEEERLALIWSSFSPRDRHSGMSLVEFQELRQSLRATLQMGAFDYRSSVVRGNEGAFEISTARISQDLLAVLGTDPTRGRHFVDREFLPSSEPVALISTALWNRLFPESIFQTGQQLIVNDVQHQIVGIMHPTFRLPLDNPATEVSQVWTPLRISENRLQRRAAKDLDGVIARLAPGRTMAQAQAALDTRIDSLVSTLRTEYQEGWKAHLIALKEQVTAEARAPMRLLTGVALLILLVSWANVTGLLASSAEYRTRELQVRSALGASPWRLTGMLVGEALALALVAGLSSQFLFWLLASSLQSLLPAGWHRLGPLEPSLHLSLSGLFLVILTSSVCGVLVAWSALGRRAFERSRDAGPENPGKGFPLRRLLVTGQLATALALLIGLALILRSGQQIRSVEPGFRSTDITTLKLTLPASRYPDPPALNAFLSRTLGAVRAMPGVEQVGAVRRRLLADRIGTWEIALRRAPATSETRLPEWQLVSEDYFETLSIPLGEGRTFRTSDRFEKVPRVIVNQAFAEAYQEGEDPLEWKIRMGGGADNPWMPVIGVVGNTQHSGLRQPSAPRFYVLLSDFSRATGFGPQRSLSLMVRSPLTSRELGDQIAQTLSSVDPGLAVSELRTLEDIIRSAESQTHFSTTLILIFASCAILMAAAGVYGIVSAQVTRRIPEIGLRIALGATRGEILRAFLKHSTGLLVPGILIGAVQALLLVKLLEDLLFGVAIFDPVSWLSGGGLIAIVCLLASVRPAHRAACVDPMTTLRHQ